MDFVFTDGGQSVKPAELECFPMLFVKSDLTFDFPFFHKSQVFQVQLVPEASKCGHVEPRRQLRFTQGLLMRRFGDMGPHGGKRIQVGQPALNPEPFHGIRVIGSPYLRRVAQHSQIKAVSAADSSPEGYGDGGEKSVPARHIVPGYTGEKTLLDSAASAMTHR